MKARPYKRLPGRRLASMVGRQSLWLGEDHVLSVASTGYTEQYRRFFLRDIAALVVQRTRRWMVWNIILGAVGGFLGLLVAAVLGAGAAADSGFAIFLLVAFVAPSLVALVVHLLRGPTCSVRILTAVQASEIPAVGRLRAAEKLLAELAPLIRAAQAATSPAPPGPTLSETPAAPAAPVA